MELFDAMTVTVPPGVSGDVHIAPIHVTALAAHVSALRALRGIRGRGCPEGTYTGLYRRGALWMSDTPAEKHDHYGFLLEAQDRRAARVLISGLGLGMVISGLLTMGHVRHIDVVEIDADVIALVGDHYRAAAAAAGKTLDIHHADAYTIRWPAATRWDVAWHDIWAELCTDNLEFMTSLHRRYGRRVSWQDSWSKKLLRAKRRREQRSDW